MLQKPQRELDRSAAGQINNVFVCFLNVYIVYFIHLIDS